MFLLIVLFFEAYLSVSWLGSFWIHEPSLFWIYFFALQILFASQLWLYFLFFKSEANDTVRFESPLRNFAFLSMGILSFLFCFTLVRDVLAVIFLPFGHATFFYSEDAAKIILGLTLLSFGIGYWNARFRVQTPSVTVPIADLPKSLKGLKIVQLSDMHLGTGPNHHQIKKLVDQALDLSPEIITLTGDIFDGMLADMVPELKHLSRLKAPYGVYFVLGNHECYWDWQACVAKVKEMGFIPLLNEGIVVKVRESSIYIAGLTDPAAANAGGVAPQIPAVPPESAFNLLLVHQPQFAKEVARFPYHLQLSGHTHGGQFFPWNWVVKKMYPISSGLGKESNLWVYVSRGSGYWGPPLRLGTLGEVTELNLE